jgi:hypothetical protein
MEKNTHSTPRFMILKTTREHFEKVRTRQRRALPGRIVRAQKGDLLLIAEMQDKGPAPVRYAMHFKDQRADDARESEAIWRKPWSVIVEGEHGFWLTTPFAPAALQPRGSSGRGGTLVHELPEDADELRRDGRLPPLLGDAFIAGKSNHPC